jgi:transcriptional regulator with XRE-family HTH domain
MESALKEKITERMEAKNFSIAELERRAGLSIHSVRNILKGRIKKPSAQSLQAIAEALECSIIDLMNNSPTLGDGFSHETERHMRKNAPLECPELMLDCTRMMLDLLGEKKAQISVDAYLEIVKKVYFYSSKEEPRTLDVRFAQWLLECHLDDPRNMVKR